MPNTIFLIFLILIYNHFWIYSNSQPLAHYVLLSLFYGSYGAAPPLSGFFGRSVQAYTVQPQLPDLRSPPKRMLEISVMGRFSLAILCFCCREMIRLWSTAHRIPRHSLSHTDRFTPPPPPIPTFMVDST
jgi:hypothetical protein